MKRIILVSITAIIIPLLSSCTSINSKDSSSQKNEFVNAVESFDWLIGDWKRNNEEEGKETFEVWRKVTDSEFVGLGFTIQHGDTINHEEIKLIKLDGKWNLEVKTPDEIESTVFKMSHFTNMEFTCENELLNFPKMIKYWKNGDKLNALVSGGDMEIEFEFERLREQ